MNVVEVIKRIKELLVYAQVVVKNTSMVISRCFFEEDDKEIN